MEQQQAAYMRFSRSSPSIDSYYSPHDEGYSKAELGMDSESSLTGLEDVLISRQSHNNSSNAEDGVALVHRHHHTSSQVPDPNSGQVFPPSMTPIDKLYSMQSSYFSGNDCECLGAAPN